MTDIKVGIFIKATKMWRRIELLEQKSSQNLRREGQLAYP